MICKNCGNQINGKAKFCSKCGASILDQETPVTASEQKPETQSNNKTGVEPVIQSEGPKKIWFLLVIIVLEILWCWIFFNAVSRYILPLKVFFIWAAVFCGLMLINQMTYYVLKGISKKKGANNVA